MKMLTFGPNCSCNCKC